MSANTPHIPFTYEDYRTLPEDTGRRFELMDGDLYRMPAPTVAHQATVLNILYALVQHVRASNSGIVLQAPVDVVLGEPPRRDVVQPDIVFVARERMHIVTPAEVAGPPDLVVEVASPGTTERDHGYKRTLYERSGVREYWIVDPGAHTLIFFAATAGRFDTPQQLAVGATLTSRAVPGFTFALADAFTSGGPAGA